MSPLSMVRGKNFLPDCLTFPLHCDELCPVGAGFSLLTIKGSQIACSDRDVNTEGMYIWAKYISPECAGSEIHLITYEVSRVWM